MTNLRRLSLSFDNEFFFNDGLPEELRNLTLLEELILHVPYEGALMHTTGCLGNGQRRPLQMNCSTHCTYAA